MAFKSIFVSAQTDKLSSSAKTNVALTFSGQKPIAWISELVSAFHSYHETNLSLLHTICEVTANKPAVPLPRTNYYKNSFSYSDAVLWNSLASIARQPTSLIPNSDTAFMKNKPYFFLISYSYSAIIVRDIRISIIIVIIIIIICVYGINCPCPIHQASAFVGRNLLSVKPCHVTH